MSSKKIDVTYRGLDPLVLGPSRKSLEDELARLTEENSALKVTQQCLAERVQEITKREQSTRSKLDAEELRARTADRAARNFEGNLESGLDLIAKALEQLIREIVKGEE